MTDTLDFTKPGITKIWHGGQFVGTVNSKGDITFFETHPKELIRAVGGGFGVNLGLAYHPQIQLYKFFYRDKMYAISKKKLIHKGRKVKLGNIYKLALPLYEFSIEDEDQPDLFD